MSRLGSSTIPSSGSVSSDIYIALSPSNLFGEIPETIDDILSKALQNCDENNSRRMQETITEFFSDPNINPPVCPICKEENKPDLDRVILPCSHLICTSCIFTWFCHYGIWSSIDCPYCKHPGITTKTITRLGRPPASPQGQPREGTLSEFSPSVIDISGYVRPSSNPSDPTPN